MSHTATAPITPPRRINFSNDAATGFAVVTLFHRDGTPFARPIPPFTDPGALVDHLISCGVNEAARPALMRTASAVIAQGDRAFAASLSLGTGGIPMRNDTVSPTGPSATTGQIQTQI